MITAQDLEYHHTAADDYTWAETYYLPLSLPAERLFGHVYICTRPVLGSMSADVRFMGAVCESEYEMLYTDAQYHLPAPKRFSHIETPTGLTVRAVRPPRDYRIDYAGRDGTEIHVEMQGLMRPFDIHDPQENPLAGTTPEERLKRTSMGSGYKGHFDMHCHTRGTIRLRGREYVVDTPDRMNHSWGPRPEMEIPPMNSVWACFGDEFGLRFHTHWDPTRPAGQDQKFAHGYLLENGEVMALTDVQMTTTRVGTVPITIEAIATDQRGRRHTVRGVPLAGAPWRAYSAAICWVGLIRWEMDGRIGSGSFQENHSLPLENARRGRFWTDPIPAITG